MTEAAKESLDTVARRIEQNANQSADLVITAGNLILEARRRVKDGEAGEISWSAWARDNIDLSDSRLRELQRIAAADDPEKAVKRQRAATQKRVAAHRANNATKTQSLDQERHDLIAWVKKAPIDQVRQVLNQVNGQLNATANSRTETQSTEANRQAV